MWKAWKGYSCQVKGGKTRLIYRNILKFFPFLIYWYSNLCKIESEGILKNKALHKISCFSLSISSVNLATSAVSCRFLARLLKKFIMENLTFGVVKQWQSLYQKLVTHEFNCNTHFWFLTGNFSVLTRNLQVIYPSWNKSLRK